MCTYTSYCLFEIQNEAMFFSRMLMLWKKDTKYLIDALLGGFIELRFKFECGSSLNPDCNICSLHSISATTNNII